MQRVFKTKTFKRWSRKTGIGDEVLCAAVKEMIQGQARSCAWAG
jgi:hypothetical protein